jgi:hypothetical protein
MVVETLLMRAILDQNPDNLQELLENGEDFNEFQGLPLRMAISEKNFKAIFILCEKGAKIKSSHFGSIKDYSLEEFLVIKNMLSFELLSVLFKYLLSWSKVDMDIIYYILQFPEIEFDLEILDAYFRDWEIMLNAEQCVPGSYYDKEIGRVQHLRQIILQSNAMTKHLYSDVINYHYIKPFIKRERRRRAKKLLNGFVAIIFLKRYLIRFRKRYYSPPLGKGYLAAMADFHSLI